MSSVDMLEARMVLHAHHGMLRLRRASIVASSFLTLVIFIIITAMLVCIVLRTLMLMRAAVILEAT